jgi:putative endonuclease
MKGYTYILECSDGSYYTGSTRNLKKRLWEHANGLGANFTRKRLPFKLIFVEEYSRVDYAFYREKQIQGWSRAKKKAFIKGDDVALYELSRNYSEYPRKKAGRPVSSSSSATGS